MFVALFVALAWMAWGYVACCSEKRGYLSTIAVPSIPVVLVPVFMFLYHQPFLVGAWPVRTVIKWAYVIIVSPLYTWRTGTDKMIRTLENSRWGTCVVEIARYLIFVPIGFAVGKRNLKKRD